MLYWTQLTRGFNLVSFLLTVSSNREESVFHITFFSWEVALAVTIWNTEDVCTEHCSEIFIFVMKVQLYLEGGTELE